MKNKMLAGKQLSLKNTHAVPVGNIRLKVLTFTIEILEIVTVVVSHWTELGKSKVKGFCSFKFSTLSGKSTKLTL